MLDAIRYNLSNLTDFSGRDARQTFWFYVLFLIVLYFGVGLIASIPLYVSMAGQLIDAIGSSGVEPDPELIAAGMVASMSEYLRVQVWVSAAIEIVMIGLILAAFVRRLHDGGFSGWIAVIPAATTLFSIVYDIIVLDDILAVMGEMMDPANSADAMAMQAEVAPYSAVAWIGYLVVIGFGVLRSQSGSNRFGGEPARR